MLFFLHRTFHLIPLGIQTDQLLKYTLYMKYIFKLQEGNGKGR